ncbi:hypothetical protein DHEL01_v206505 [Diaporthe helianthi]|uniref:Uncharacterized protein n=1 Tax=Diaporthe helianthi TaxID=158607 RepID=A0A2P5HXY7_DIAHE|nr:hypothetical protein DHEL01_v206505 [Diaporthe helianthi]
MDVMVARLRDVALYAHLHRITLENLTTDHLNIFHRALLHILGSELARDTFAQIVDGLPIADVAWDKRHPGIFGDDHPIEAHATLCPGVKDKTSACLEQYDLHSLAFGPQTVQAYQNAPLGSKAFQTRLIELVVLALHQIAVDLFKRDDLRSHSHQEIDTVTSCAIVPPKSLTLKPDAYAVTVPPRPTLFNHPYYVDLDIYPEGLADIVGYWAEDRIIGGIVLFDRKADPRDPRDRPNASEDQGEEEAGGGRNPAEKHHHHHHHHPPNIWLHPARDRVTDRICQLHDDQQKALVDYLLLHASQVAAPGQDTSNPLPILPHKGNRTRVDPSIAHTHNLVFREYWDRKPATQELLDFLLRVPQNELDYPEIRDFMNRLNALEKEWDEAKDTQK